MDHGDLICSMWNNANIRFKWTPELEKKLLGLEILRAISLIATLTLLLKFIKESMI